MFSVHNIICCLFEVFIYDDKQILRLRLFRLVSTLSLKITQLRLQLIQNISFHVFLSSLNNIIAD